ncbi:MAG: AmmeMemoRadiSam system radical SAM enzyme [Acidobacteriota bacterium]
MSTRPSFRNQSLGEILAARTREGELYEKLPGNRLRCYACGHRCLILEGLPGICKVRFNSGGTLQVPTGYVGALQCDPVEKKPFFHALPGSLAMSFGMLGCDLHCSYCQNWITSQVLRDSRAVAPPEDISAEELVALTRRNGARIIASTYNEPLITSEWAVEVFRLAQKEGFKTAFISNGNGTPEVLDYLRPWVQLYKVDLKSFQDKSYRRLGGTLEAVLNTISGLHQRRFWVEVVTLVIPGFNDSDAELREVAHFLADLSVDIPWHVTAFHKDYKMTDPDNTPVQTLIRACEIGKSAGLRYVYAGNIPGKVGAWENTYCPTCHALLIERYGFHVLRNELESGSCPSCRTPIAGVWS